METKIKFIPNKEPSGVVLTKEVRDYFKALGSIKTPARARASRENGKKGGRPKKVK